MLSERIPATEQIGDWLDELLAPTEDAIKHDRTTTVKRVSLGDQELIVKRYNARSRWHVIKRALRQTRAQRCWEMSHRFQQSGLNVAAPLLMHERRWGPFKGNAYFVTEFLRGKELLILLPEMNSADQQLVAQQIQQAFAIMQREQLTHGDMKASNLLWVDDQLVFVDLDAASIHQSTLSWQRSHARDLKRFMKNWRGHPELLELFSDYS